MFCKAFPIFVAYMKKLTDLEKREQILETEAQALMLKVAFYQDKLCVNTY
jgi:hypothetical protein